jgi:hypothetical protein
MNALSLVTSFLDLSFPVPLYYYPALRWLPLMDGIDAFIWHHYHACNGETGSLLYYM